MASFLLTKEPWIPCEAPGGRVELSVRDVFSRAPELHGVADTSPLHTITLYRFLLAILHRVFGPPDVGSWKELYERRAFDTHRLNAYLDEWEHRFDLFHPERPFYQTRGLRDLGYEPDGLGRLVFERSNYGAPLQVFQHRPVSRAEVLSPAMAARCLLALQAFVPGGLVRKSGEPNSASAGPLNRGALVLLRGANLFETLLLNLLVYAPDDGKPIVGQAAKDIPSWEAQDLARPTASKEPERRAHGWIDRLTFISRRLELAHAADGTVTGVVYCVGQGLDDTDSVDPMFARLKTDKELRVLEFSEQRVTWRDSHAVLRTNNSDYAEPPAALRQLARRELRSVIGQSNRFALELYGMRGDQAKIKLTRCERFILPRTVLEDPDRAELVREATLVSEGGASALREALRRLVTVSLAPAGRSPDPADVKDIAAALGTEQAYWANLSAPFHLLLDGLDIDSSGARDQFLRAVRDAAASELRRATHALGSTGGKLKGAALAEVTLRQRLAELTNRSEVHRA